MYVGKLITSKLVIVPLELFLRAEDTMGWTVAKQPKNKSENNQQEGRPEGGNSRPKLPEKVSEPVKLRPTFKLRLQRVALNRGVDMGVLIEERMAKEIEKEYREIVQKELDDLRKQDEE